MSDIAEQIAVIEERDATDGNVVIARALRQEKTTLWQVTKVYNSSGQLHNRVFIRLDGTDCLSSLTCTVLVFNTVGCHLGKG